MVLAAQQRGDQDLQPQQVPDRYWFPGAQAIEMVDSGRSQPEDPTEDALPYRLLPLPKALFAGPGCGSLCLAGAVRQQQIVRGHPEQAAHRQNAGSVRQHLSQFPAGDCLAGDTQFSGQGLLAHAPPLPELI